MRFFLKRLRRTVTISLCVAMLCPGMLMAETIEQTAFIPLKFLEPLKRDADWLREELAAKGLRSNFKIAAGTLASADLKVIRYVNRIRTFAYLDGFDEVPYFDLRLRDPAGGAARCITPYPRDILPQLGVLGFREETFEVPDVKAEALDACRVSSPITAEFAQMGRQSFRTRYFGKWGELLINEFAALNRNPDFTARAMDLGFFAYEGSYSGSVHIALDKPG